MTSTKFSCNAKISFQALNAHFVTLCDSEDTALLLQTAWKRRWMQRAWNMQKIIYAVEEKEWTAWLLPLSKLCLGFPSKAGIFLSTSSFTLLSDQE